LKRVIETALDWAEHFSVRVLSPVISGFVGVSGFCVTYNFDSERAEYPNFKGVWDVLDAPFWTVVLIVSFAILVLNTGFLAWRAPTRKALREERDKARDAAARVGENILLLMDGLLLNLSRKLKFSLNGHSRVSLYVFDESSRAFIPCGRFSHNPKYREKGRTKFHIDQGCIGEAWQRDWAFDDQIPADVTAAVEYHKESMASRRRPASVPVCMSV